MEPTGEVLNPSPSVRRILNRFGLSIDYVGSILHVRLQHANQNHLFSLSLEACQRLMKGLVVYVANTRAANTWMLFHPDQTLDLVPETGEPEWRNDWTWILAHFFEDNASCIIQALLLGQLFQHYRTDGHSLQPVGQVVAYWISILYLARGLTVEQIPIEIINAYDGFIASAGPELRGLRPRIPFYDALLQKCEVTPAVFPNAWAQLQPIFMDLEPQEQIDVHDDDSMEGNQEVSAMVQAPPFDDNGPVVGRITNMSNLQLL